jgi:hypothetical protein
MKTLLIIVAVIFAVTLLAWWFSADPLAVGNWSGQANEAIKPWRTVLMISRWGLWCLLWWRWERVGQRLFTGEPEGAQRAQWTRMRNRMMGGIAVVEVIIVFSTMTGNQAWV